MQLILRYLITALLVFASFWTSADSAGIDAHPFAIETAGQGRSVYLVSGLSNAGDVWDDLAARLRQAGYRTHVLTLSGFGGRPALGDGPFLPPVRDALAVELAQRERRKPVVIGHSLGGFLAFWLGATESPHLAGIIAIDGVPFLPALGDPSATPESQAASAEGIRSFMASLSHEQLARQSRMSLQAMLQDESERERIVQTSTRSDPAAMSRAVAELMTTDLRSLMTDVAVPELLLQAADSGSNPALRAAFGAQIAAIPEHRHVVAERGSHFIQLDDPEFTAREVLAFLEALGDE